MAASVIYLELFVALFFMPGLFLTVILGINKSRFLLSFALSYALLVFTLLPFEYYDQPVARWEHCVLGVWVILTAWAAAILVRRGFRPLASIRAFRRSRRGLLRLIVPLLLAGVTCGYLAYAGPYLEVPSDVWNHVFLFQTEKTNIVDVHRFPADSPFNALFITPGSGIHWYFLHAWLCRLSGLAIMDSVRILTAVTVLTFLLAVYYFGLFLFAGLRLRAPRKMTMAFAASLFAAATMGNTVFAYIRYYALAPAILNYVLFLAAMAVVIPWMKSDRWTGHALWMMPVLVAAACAIHIQEALFIFFMTWALSLVAAARLLGRIFARRNFSLEADKPEDNPAGSGDPAYKACCRPGAPTGRMNPSRRLPPKLFKTDNRAINGNRWTAGEWKALILAVFLLLVFLSCLIVLRHVKPGAWSDALVPPAGRPPQPLYFVFSHWPVTLPQNFWLRLAVGLLHIFYQTVGCWGVFVYGLFIVTARQFIKQPYLIAGMGAPLLTIFNPLAMDMMVRMDQTITIYRYLFMIPLPFVGGYLLVYFWDRAREWARRMRRAPAAGVSRIRPRASWICYGGCLLALAGLVGLIFPIRATGIDAPYSKLFTLRKIPPGNDYHLFDDVGKIVAAYTSYQIILTDRWTAGYLAFYAPQNPFVQVKWLDSYHPDQERPEPYTWLYLRRRGLIVINRRNGEPSITGKISRHWPEDVILNAGRRYSPEVPGYLESHPEIFRKVWSRDRIAVYAVR